MSKFQVKRTTRTEIIEADYWQIERGGTLTLFRELPTPEYYERVKSFNVRAWVEVEQVVNE